jgi:hypothetical protein
MLHLYQEIREVSKTIPDVIVKIYLYWLLSALVISNFNRKRAWLIKSTIIFNNPHSFF